MASNQARGLLIDAAGDLFGTTQGGGVIGGEAGGGTVFEAVRESGGGYSLNTLVTFDGNDGAAPTNAGVIADAAGNLFGTTATGPVNLGGGTVFEISKTNGSYASAPKVLVGFDGTDGGDPVAGLVADTAGDLFGTTSHGGTNLGGTVFEIQKIGAGYATTRPSWSTSSVVTLRPQPNHRRLDYRCRRGPVRHDVPRRRKRIRDSLRNSQDCRWLRSA